MSPTMNPSTLGVATQILYNNVARLMLIRLMSVPVHADQAQAMLRDILTIQHVKLLARGIHIQRF
ncbi:hypothetical protein B0H11DRAFT_2213975 [Mycena galericulata]|nr:hypothetical protein B0H11DRAFT_2213975 [Mycena galericulata]